MTLEFFHIANHAFLTGFHDQFNSSGLKFHGKLAPTLPTVSGWMKSVSLPLPSWYPSLVWVWHTVIASDSYANFLSYSWKLYFFPPQWKGECQLVNVGILLLKCECQRGGSSRTVPHIVHREGEKYQWDDICSKTTWLDGTLCAQAWTFMPCQNIYCLTALCLYSGQCFALSLLKERFCECLVVFIFLFYLKIITRVKTVWNQPGSSLESDV